MFSRLLKVCLAVLSLDQTIAELHNRADLGKLALTKEERAWLEKNAPFLSADYLDYLESFRYKPEEQVTVDYIVEDKDAQGQELGRFEIEIKGGWAATILYEVSPDSSLTLLLCRAFTGYRSRAAGLSS